MIIDGPRAHILLFNPSHIRQNNARTVPLTSGSRDRSSNLRNKPANLHLEARAFIPFNIYPSGHYARSCYAFYKITEPVRLQNSARELATGHPWPKVSHSNQNIVSQPCPSHNHQYTHYNHISSLSRRAWTSRLDST